MALVLTFRPGGTMTIGPDIRIEFISTGTNRVRVAITAPESMKILRDDTKNKEKGGGTDANDTL